MNDREQSARFFSSAVLLWRMSTTTAFDIQPEERQSAMIAGGIIGVLGLLAIVFPYFAGISLSILLGAALVVGALVHVGHAFSVSSWSLTKAFWQVVLGLVYGLAGVLLIANPVIGLATLTFLVIAFLVLEGVVEVGWGLVSRGSEGWVWLLFSGIVSLGLAVLLLVGLPWTAVWAVGLYVGVNLLITGVTLIMLGMKTPRPAEGGTMGGEQSGKSRVA